MYTLESLDTAVIFICGEQRIRITFPSAEVARITYTVGQDYRRDQSLIVLPQSELHPLDVSEDSGFFYVTAGMLLAEVNKSTGALTYRDKCGEVLHQEPSSGGKRLTRKAIYRNIFRRESPIETGASIDGARSEAEVERTEFDRSAFEARLEFSFSNNEAIFGFGSHEEGYGNLRGKYRDLYQQNMKACVPCFVSTKGYGILFDCCSLMTFHDDAYGSYVWLDVVDELDYYFIAGGSTQVVTANYYSLTGKPPLPPRWAFGYIQSKERYVNAQEMLDVVREYRRREIPLDAIVLDWNSWPSGQWGQKSLDPLRFPNPRLFTDELHALGAKLMVSVWPIMMGEGDNQMEFRSRNLMLGNQATYDAFQGEGRRLYWEQADRGLFSQGVDAWWCDCTEPFEADWKGTVKPEPHQRIAINTEQSKKYLDDGQINAYSLVHSQGIYEGQRNMTNRQRVINLTRSSFAGQHRYGTFTWNGDVSATWETLRRSIPEGCNFCATGEPYWTVDIGGFFIDHKDPWFWSGDYEDGCRGILPGEPLEPLPSDTGCVDLGYWELYVRWLQYGTFLPMMRSHGTSAPREIWRFGERGGVFYDAIAKFIRLRYRLNPYIYSVAAAIAATGASLVSAVALRFPGDPQTFDLLDQYFFGPSIMVCPVTVPMYYGRNSEELAEVEKRRNVYLPTGPSWYSFWNNDSFTGGQTICAAAPLDIMPIFVPSGSIIPLGRARQFFDKIPEDRFEICIYSGADASFELYDDASDGYDYEVGASSKILLDWKDRKFELTIGASAGSYPRMPNIRFFDVVVVSEHGVFREQITHKHDQASITRFSRT